jgi:hypothetical protein
MNKKAKATTKPFLTGAFAEGRPRIVRTSGVQRRAAARRGIRYRRVADGNFKSALLREPDNKRSSVQNAPAVIEPRPVSRVQTHACLEVLELENRLKIRSDICRFLTRYPRVSTACCFTLIFLQGFHAWGFQMNESFLRWLCALTIGQRVALLGIFARAVWHKPPKSP